MLEFRIEKVTDEITRIYGFCTELMYLIEGKNKCALIDTGSGFGSLKRVVDRLTDKPVVVLLTHGHTDHAMGASEFDEVYMNHEDDFIYAKHGDNGFRLSGIEMSDIKDIFNEQEDYIPTADVNSFKDLEDGMVFDLGGLTIECISMAGHTKGSMAILLREKRILITGDACNNFTFLFEEESLSVTEYQKSLEEFLNKVHGQYTKVLSSHGTGKLALDIIEGVIEVCKDIRKGQTDDILLNFRGSQGWIAKKNAGMGQPRVDGKSGNIVYNKKAI